MAKFKLDENLPVEAAALLSGAKHDAVTVVEQGLGGKADSDLARACQSEQRAIVTLDLDFADVRQYPPGDTAGIIVFRLARLDKQRVLNTFERLLPILASETLTGKLWIVEETRVRIRG